MSWQQDLRMDWATWSVGGYSRNASWTCSTRTSLDTLAWELRCDLKRRSGSDRFGAGCAAPERQQERTNREKHPLQPRYWRDGYMTSWSWNGSVNGSQRPGERHKGTCDSKKTKRTKSTSGFGNGSLAAAMLRWWCPCWDATTELRAA